MKTRASNIVTLVNTKDLKKIAHVEDNEKTGKPQSKHLKLLLANEWKTVDSLSAAERKTLSSLYNCGTGAGEIVEAIWESAQPPAKKAPLLVA